MPVWNGLTDAFHPTQMLADMLTVEENFGNCKGLKFVFMGDARNNVANSLMVVCAKLGVNFVACGPKEQMPAADLVETCKAIAAENGSTITLTDDVKEGTKGAHVIYTDIWVSMGEPDSVWAERIKLLKPYQVNKEVMANADPNAIFMHCLPVLPRPQHLHRRVTSTRSSAFPRWKLPTRCSRPSSPRCSTRPRTACTPSRP